MNEQAPPDSTSADAAQAQAAIPNSAAAMKPPVYVGIGASAGGLEALRFFVGALPKDNDMIYVVAQHLSPQYRSMMAELLSRETKLKVIEIVDGMVPALNCVYIAPPNGNVLLKNGQLRLRESTNHIGPKPSVDFLLTSLAEEVGHQAIGIILSGTGSDGAHGMRAVKAAGGICIAQKPETAKYDSMPLAAIKAGADLVMAPEEIGKELRSISQRPRIPTDITTEAEDKPSPVDLLIRRVFARTRMDFSNYKTATLSRQIERRMAVLQSKGLDDYVSLVEKEPSELDALAKSFLICVTSFFRDAQAFDGFKQYLPEMLAGKKPGDSIRIWVPACASGEEAYSLAILLAEYLGDKISDYTILIFATDINHEATQTGRKGLYPEAALDGIDETLRQKYFQLKDDQYLVNRRIRDMVVFAIHDIIQDPPFLRVDLISCRNLLIYFKQGLQEKVMRLFHYALNPRGALILGASETTGQNTIYFHEMDRRCRLYRRRDIQSPSPASFTTAPLMPLASRRATGGAKPKSLREIGLTALVSQYVPPSLLITPDGSILEFFGDVTNFISLKDAKTDFNLFSILHPAFRTEIRALVQKVSRTFEVMATNRIKIGVDGETKLFRAVVRMATPTDKAQQALLINFEGGEAPSESEATLDPDISEDSTRMAELEHDLAMTRESLQTVIEELETSNEELQSLNEEAQAANEELQSTNEELETSNEELQATNEELTTVNDELTSRTHQLGLATDDLTNILNSSGVAILVVDRVLQIRQHNKLASDFFELGESISHQNLATIPWKFASVDFIEKVKAIAQSTSATSTRLGAEDRVVVGRFTINSRIFDVHALPYLSKSDDVPGGAVITIAEITDHHQAEQALQLSQAKLANYMQLALAASYWEYNVNKGLFTFTDDFYRMMGTSAQEIGGYEMSLRDYLDHFCHEVDQTMVREAFDQAKGKGPSEHSVQIEHRFRMPDKAVGVLRVCFYVVNETQGNLKRIYGVSQDITVQRKSVLEIEEAKRQAEAANKAKTQFLSSMSHELRTPLNAIIGFSQLLESSSSQNEVHNEYARQIFDSGNHLLSLISQILDLASVEARKASLISEAVPVDDLVQSTMLMFTEQAASKKLNLVVTNNLSKKIRVLGDATRIKQVLVNLVSNAIKYTPTNGNVNVSVDFEGTESVRFTVTDNGIGIAQEYQSQVFTAFNRLGLNHSLAEGTGIGLAISKNLVEQMAGSIGFESQQGVGSTFWFSLAIAPLGTASAWQPVRAESISIDSLKRKAGKILLIEDNQTNILLIKAIFKKVPRIELLVATDGVTGIQICRDQQPDLVLMDVQLPDISGFDAARTLTTDPRTSHIPIFGLSADAQKSTVSKALASGMRDYLTKPIKIDTLISLVGKLLPTKKS